MTEQNRLLTLEEIKREHDLFCNCQACCESTRYADTPCLDCSSKDEFFLHVGTLKTANYHETVIIPARIKEVIEEIEKLDIIDEFCMEQWQSFKQSKGV